MTESRSLSLNGVSVAIGFPAHRPIPPMTLMSMVKTIHKLTEMGIAMDLVMEISGSAITSRDGVLDSFLAGDKDKLFWIDSDMVWEADDFLRLLAISTEEEIVCAAYPAKADGEPQFFADIQPVQDGHPLGLVEINGIGLGFAVMSRAAAEHISANAPRVLDQIAHRDMASVFRFDVFNGNRRTEDMAFFADLRELGYHIWLDPMINLGHVGEKEYRGSVLSVLHATEALKVAAE